MFIWYACSDGANYAETIGAFLADPKRKVSCRIARWNTTLGTAAKSRSPEREQFLLSADTGSFRQVHRLSYFFCSTDLRIADRVM